MTIETKIAVAARDALPRFTSQSSYAFVETTPAEDELAAATPEEGVSLSLSARGRLLSALAAGSEELAGMSMSSAASAASTAVSTAPSDARPDQPLPITRATLFAIEARLVRARAGAAAIATADAERPASSDPQRLAQAEQATASLYGRVANPFANLGRAQLSAIVYDERGAYTTNERYAAASQRDELDRQFWAPVLQRALASGDWRPMIEAGLVFYANLSPLEQTAYPANYLLLMQQYLAIPEPTAETPLPSQQQADLVSMLASLVLPGGPLAQASGMLRGLLLARSAPSTAAELEASMPRLVTMLTVNQARMSQDQAYLVLLQRVFGVNRRDDEPVPVRRAGAGQLARDMLSFADRRFLADAYAFAAMSDASNVSNVYGLAVEQIDDLAADLATYRMVRAAALAQDGTAPSTSGPQSYRMSVPDMLVARRLLTSSAARQTQLDHAFLAWLLDPRGGGWSEGERSGHRIGLSALEKLLAGLAGVGVGQDVQDEASLESDYRYALYRISLQEASAARVVDAGMARMAPSAMQAVQMAALARAGVADRDFMESALALLRMYRFSLRMTDVEQRTLSELVYASVRRRRLRTRRGRLFVAWDEQSPSMPTLPR